MDGQLNNIEVICCFCGGALFMKDAVLLTVQPSVEQEETQQLFCHKAHFVSLIDKSVPLHPDLLDD